MTAKWPWMRLGIYFHDVKSVPRISRDREVSWNGGTPGSHPFSIGIFHEINQPFWGSPIEPPRYCQGIQAPASFLPPGMPLLFDEDGIDQPFPMPAGEPWVPIMTICRFVKVMGMSDVSGRRFSSFWRIFLVG